MRTYKIEVMCPCSILLSYFEFQNLHVSVTFLSLKSLMSKLAKSSFAMVAAHCKEEEFIKLL